MKITDKRALHQLRIVNCCELDESVESYPESERDGRSDLQFVADEISYFASCYDEDGHCWHDDLAQSRRILAETENGKVMPLSMRSLRPKYRESEIMAARNTVNEYRRFKNAVKRLANMGYYGRW